MKSPQKPRKREMSKQAMREETERLVKEALEASRLSAVTKISSQTGNIIATVGYGDLWVPLVLWPL